MAIISLPTQEFAQDVPTALSATENGPVFITDSGVDTHVLLSYSDYQHLLARKGNIAENGPVFVTDHGKPAYVLLSDADYQRLLLQRRNIADLLAMPNASDVEFEAPRVNLVVRPADFT